MASRKCWPPRAWIGRARAASLIAIAALTSCAATSAASALDIRSEKSICSHYRCRTIAASAQIRVVDAIARRLQQQTPSAIKFAEWLPTGRITVLAQTSVHGPVPSHFAIAGQFLAYAAGYAEEPANFSEDVVLLNVKTGRRRETVREGFTTKGSRGVVQVAVTPAGSAAWMIEGVFVNPTLPRPSEKASGRAVYALPAGAKEEVLLAYSLGIVPLSLAATSGHIYWLEAGGPRTYAAR